MSEHEDSSVDELSESAVDEAGGDEEALPRLNLQVDVQSPSACERHVTVTVPRDDIERYFDRAFSDMMGTAAVPGFRAGRAPRKLVESRFRKDVSEQVKGSLLMDSLTQVTEDQKFSAISEPDFDPRAVSIPSDGPMTFEFDLEVRPEFDLPEWKGLTVERPDHKFTPQEVAKQLEMVLTRHGRLVPHEGPAQAGDYITCNLKFVHEGQTISEGNEEVIRLKPVLSFRDGKIEKFDKQMKGVRAGETRELPTKLSQDAPNEALRGKDVTAVFEVLEVKKLELPELTPEFLEEMGGFETEGDLKDAIKDSLERQLEYYQQQSARRQITTQLTRSANWDLPPGLLRRQSRRELERAVLEMRRSGFGDAEIQAQENELRQNSSMATARALKEHFILERIAEEEKIEAETADYDEEVRLIAAQSNSSPRRVRAKLEKEGMMDTLRNQIIERKVIDLVLQHATFKDVPYTPEGLETEAVDQAAGGEEEQSDIPTVAEASSADENT